MPSTRVYFWISCGSVGALLLCIALILLAVSGIVAGSVLFFVQAILAIAVVAMPIVGLVLFALGLILLKSSRDKFLIAGILCNAAILIFLLCAFLPSDNRL